jgi:hypothetical protein
MERLYPRALLECIQENRLPRQEEIETVARKISREAFPDGGGADMAIVLARTAMIGTRGGVRSGMPREV